MKRVIFYLFFFNLVSRYYLKLRKNNEYLEITRYQVKIITQHLTSLFRASVCFYTEKWLNNNNKKTKWFSEQHFCKSQYVNSNIQWINMQMYAYLTTENLICINKTEWLLKRWGDETRRTCQNHTICLLVRV